VFVCAEVATLSHDNYYKHRPNLSDEVFVFFNFFGVYVWIK